MPAKTASWLRLPQLLHARANAPYDNIIWNTWFTSYTEESVVTTPQGNHAVIVAVHGGGIYASPERFERTYRASVDTEQPRGLHRAVFRQDLSTKEAGDVLDGKLPDGTEIPIYSIRRVQARYLPSLPLRYGVVLDFELARKVDKRLRSLRGLERRAEHDRRAPAASSRLAAYLDKAQARHNTKKMGNWHPYNRIDPKQPQTRVVFLAGNQGGVGTEDEDDEDYGYDAEYGIGGDACIHNMARYVAVAPRDVATSLRHLDFEI